MLVNSGWLDENEFDFGCGNFKLLPIEFIVFEKFRAYCIGAIILLGLSSYFFGFLNKFCSCLTYNVWLTDEHFTVFNSIFYCSPVTIRSFQTCWSEKKKRIKISNTYVSLVNQATVVLSDELNSIIWQNGMLFFSMISIRAYLFLLFIMFIELNRTKMFFFSLSLKTRSPKAQWILVATIP